MDRNQEYVGLIRIILLNLNLDFVAGLLDQLIIPIIFKQFAECLHYFIRNM